MTAAIPNEFGGSPDSAYGDDSDSSVATSSTSGTVTGSDGATVTTGSDSAAVGTGIDQATGATGWTGTGTDDSPFAALKDESDLQFNSEVAGTCYAACQTLLTNIETMMNTIATYNSPSQPLVTVNNDPTIESLHSAAEFRALLVSKWGQLYSDLYQHKLIVTDMADTFANAAHTYASTEGGSTILFKALETGNTGTITVDDSALATPNDWSSYASGASGAYTIGSGSSTADLVTADPQAASKAGDAEDGSSFSLNQFVAIANSIRANEQVLAGAADQWDSIQSTWSGWTTAFTQGMQYAMDSGEWTGDGATTAVQAVTDYVEGAVPALGQTMNAMYKTETELLSLLHAIYEEMPTNYSITSITTGNNTTYSGDGTLGNGSYTHGCHSESMSLHVLAKSWNKLYPPGLQQIAAITPAFSDPGTTTSGDSGSGSSDTSTTTSGDSGSGSSDTSSDTSDTYDSGYSAGYDAGYDAGYEAG